MAMTAVFLDYSTMGDSLDLTPLTELLPDLQVFDATTDAQVAGRIRDAEFVFVNKIRLNDALFEQAPKLRFIGLTATGTDNIDMDSAARHGVAVANIRAYCTQSVTEHVFGVLLMLTHSLGRYSAAVQQGAWQQAGDFCMLDYPVRELSLMTFGIVGLGELGRSVAQTARHFGMDVIISARPGEEMVPDGRVSFDELLERADVISLHCPLNEHTQGLFGGAEFRRMKNSAILVNTARGALVDTAALAGALRDGEIAGAAIDVLPKEPPVDGDPLLDYEGDNLIVTPHIAWSTDRARQEAIAELAANVAAFLGGEKRNRVV
jgi:glycerate dehydrogenase